jgi:hypothetical protein
MDVTADPNLIAYCGRYCGACAELAAGSCPGCKRELRPAGCVVRACCREYFHASCADCARVASAAECAVFALARGDARGPGSAPERAAAVAELKRRGYQRFAALAAGRERTTGRR